MLATFVLGAGGMWVIMYASAPEKQVVQRFFPAPPQAPRFAPETPDVSQLPPAEAARTLADWNYDRQNWAHAVEHYQKALEQYELAQGENPQHENSLFNQAGLYAEVLHDDDRALSVAREFISRFPQSPRAPAAKELINRLDKRRR